MADIRYLTDHYDEKIEKIKSYDAPLNFVFITDQHNRMNLFTTTWDKTRDPNHYEYATNAVESIQYILDRVPNIQCVVNGGDIGNDYDPDPDKIRFSHQEIMDALYKLSVPVHCCIGNHDDAIGVAWSGDRGIERDVKKAQILPDEMHKRCMKYNPTDKNYYYVDFEEQGYRFVFMNCLDKAYNEEGEYEFGWRMEFSFQQIFWLENEALNTDKSIIVFCHAPLHTAGIFGTEGLPNCQIKPYDDILNSPRAYYDVKKCKNVVALIYGHVHYDNLLYDDDLLTVTTLASLTQEWTPSCPKREFGTITETAFDVFSIKDDVVYITRFGAGEDRIGALTRKNL